MNQDNLNIPEQDSASLDGTNPALIQEVINPFVQPISNPKKSKNLAIWTTVAAILVLIFIALVGYVLVKSQKQDVTTNPNTAIGSSNFSVTGLDQLNLGQLGQLDINGILKVNNGVVIKPSSTPQQPLLGQIYLNEETDQLAYYDGAEFQTLSSSGNSVSSIGGVSGDIALGNGLTLQGNTLSAQVINNTPTASGVTSLQGQSGAVILVGGSGIGINGTTISNKGVTSLAGRTGALSIGRGLSRTGNTLLSSVSLTSASASLLVVDDGNGNYTITQVGSGSSGSVALGPALAQTDSSNFPSIDIDKTGTGDLIQFSVNGVDRFIVDQTGAITTGSLDFSQLTGTPQIVNSFIDGSSNTATGVITLGTGLSITGSTINAAAGISAVNGTANQVIANTNLGVVTLSLPQDIQTNSTPTFSGITLTGLGNGIVQSASGVLSSGSVDRNSATLFTNQLSVANGGTGSNTPGGALTNLGAAESGANNDITSLSGLTTALSVGQGGTGNQTLTQNGVLVGNGAGAISSVVAGGAGLCLTSTAGAPSWVACPGSGGVSSVNTFTGAITIQGTTNQVTVNNSSGTLTLSLPQDINTTSSPQFSALTLTSTLAVQGASATIGTAAQTGSLILNDGSSNTATLMSAALGQNVVYTLPDPGQATATICLSTGNCAGAGSGVTTGGGTNGVIPVFTASQNIEDSTLSQSGSVITASGSIVVQGALGLTLGTQSSTDGLITFNNNSGAHTVSLQAPNSDPASNLVLRLPDADGGTGDCLTTDGSGNLGFTACLSGAGGGSGGVISIDGLSGTVTVNNATGSGSAITIDDATTAAKGIASFNSSFFTVSSGAVSLATGSVTTNEIANGTITGTDIDTGTVTNANLVNSSVTVSAGTGLTGGGGVALGGSTSLNVSYGSSVATAVQGNTTIDCASGTGNLTGGGTTLTLGSGGSCGSISTIANPTFATSVTTAELIFTGAGSNGTLQVGNLGQATVFNLPDPGVASATICLSTGNCAGAGTGVTTSGGTTNAIAKFTGAQALGDSSISDNGTTVNVASNLNVTGTVTLTNDLTVTYGGTGASTFTSNGVLYGNGTGAILATAVGATGECLIGNTGSAPTWGSCAGAAGGVSSLNTFTGGVTIQGTANQVTVTNNTGTITLSLPQSINTSSSPQFTNLTLTGDLDVQGGSATLGTTSQAGTLVVYDGSSNTGTVQTAALGQNTTYTLPDPGVASVNICLSTGNCAGAGTGVTTTGGSTNSVAKFTGSQTLGDSSITDNGSVVTTSGDLAVNGGDITSSAATLNVNAGGAVDIQDNLTADSLTVDTSNVNIASGVLQTAGTTRITNGGVLQNVTNADASTFFTGGSLSVARGGTGAGTFTTNGIIYGNGTGALGVTAAGTTGQCLVATTASAPTWGSCAGSGSGSTLQAAYDNGSTISTSDARDIDITLANSTTDSNLDIQVADGSTGYVSVSRIDGVGTSDPAQLVLIDNLDTNRAVAVGIRLQAAGGGLTTGIDVSDNEIGVGLALGSNDVTVGGVTIASAEFALLDGRDGALVDTNDSVSTAITGTGALNSGSITSGFGTIDNADTITGTTINGTTGINTGAGAGTNRIDVSGNLVNIGDAAINGGDITSSAATLNINAGGNIDLQDAVTVDSLIADTGNVAITSGVLSTGGTTRLTNAGILQNITGYSQTSGTFATSGISSFSVDGTTGATYTLGASTTTGTISIGGASQTGAITLGLSTATNTINIGNAATGNGNTQTINIGTGGSGTSTTSISIGSTVGGTTYLQGTVHLANVATANNNTRLCQNSFGYLAYCSSSSGTLQQAYDADADGSDSIITLSTADDGIIIRNPSSSGSDSTYNLILDQLSTGAKGGLSIQSAGTGNLLLVSDTTATARDVLTIADTGITTFRNQTDSTDAFMIQNAAGTNTVLTVDTTNGRIGINDPNPSFELEVAGRIRTTTTDGAAGFMANFSGTGCASCAQYLGNWESSGLYGIGPLNGTNDNTIRLGNVTNEAGAWNGTQNTNLVLGSAASGGGIGIGTSTAPTARLQITSSANDTLLRITDSTATSADVLTIADGGVTTFKSQTNSTSAFQIQNASAASLFGVDSTNSGNITLLGNNGGAIGSWTTNSNTLTATTSNAGITTANGYVYLVGGWNGSNLTTVEYARVNANGSIGTFANTTALPVARSDAGAVASNGYLYMIGGDNSDTKPDVYVAKLNRDGTVGSWVKTTSLPVDRSSFGTFAYNGYIYVVGGTDDTTSVGNTYYAQQYADGSISSWTATSSFPSGAVRQGVNVSVANGYVYAMGGYSASVAQTSVHYARLNTDGSLGTWTLESDVMPAGRAWGGSAVVNGYLYYWGGVDSSTDQDEVFYTQLNSDGSTGAWVTNSTNMPSTRGDTMGFSINGYLYTLGGDISGGGQTDTVYYVTTPRISVGGNLDLVGLSGENLSEGGSGGTLTAGNTSVVGTLNVQAQANFANNVSVGGTLTVQSGIYSGQDISIGRKTNSGGTSADWSVTNSTAGTFASNTAITSIESMAVYNGSLYIGTNDSATSSAEVYRYDENLGTYTLVSSTGFGNNVDKIQSMVVYNGYLYAGTYDTNNAEVYRYDGGTTWTAVTGTGGTIGGNDTNVDAIFGMAVWHGKLYVGTYASGAAAEVYRYDGGSTWADLITTAGNICGTGGNDYLHELEVFQDQLYAATFGGADICRYDGGTTWTRVNAASGQIATGGTSSIQGVESMAVFNGALYAGTYNDDGAGSGHAEIYRYDGGTAGSWVKVSNSTAGTIASGGTSSIDIVSTLTPYNGKLYAGTWGSSGSNPDKAEVYVFDPAANSWSKVSQTTAGTIRSGGTANINGVIQMAVFNDKLYAATGETNSAEVYRFSAIKDQSYALKFGAASSLAGTTEQGTYYNEGSIYFAADLQGTNTNDNSTTGSFVFSHGITTATGAYDVAEDYPTRDGSLVPGDLVVIDSDETGFVQRSQSKQQNTLVGVYSEKPGLRLSQADGTINGGRVVPIALAGRVPVNVSLENGPIKPGDYLTSSSTPGYAMKAIEAGPTVGKSLGYFDGASGQTGKVLTFVNVSYFAPSTTDLLQTGQLTVDELNVQGSVSVSGNLNVSGDTNLTNLKVSGDSTFEGNITVANAVITKSITVNGHITTGGGTPTIEVLPILGQNSEISVEGNDSSGIITINVSSNAELTEGEIVKLIFDQAYNKTPRVIISPIGADSARLGAYVEQKQTEFVLGVTSPPVDTGTYKFNYFIVE